MTAIALMIFAGVTVGYPMWTAYIRVLRQRDALLVDLLQAEGELAEWKSLARGRRHLRGIDGGAS